jgi:LDH2 family malate/lactate/ureidoglycolate dehydrogenase
VLERFKVPEKDRVYVTIEEMRPATEAIFLAMGLSDDDAMLAADVLMKNDLRGVETHGVSNMLRNYVKLYQDGKLNPTPTITVERESDATAVIDGGGGIGLHVAPRAMDMAVEKAREFGMGSVCVHNVGHMGGSGYHAMRASDQDMIGVAMTTSGSLSTVPTFGGEPMFGTNPIAYAAPADKMPDFVFDVGTSQIAGNKVRLMERIGAEILPGWLAMPDGTPIMEEGPLPSEHHMLPIGGTREQGSHKGYGFTAVIDILGSTLTGIGPGFLALTPGFHLTAYNVDSFTDLAKFKSDMDEFLTALVDTPPAPPHERVVYAGLLEAEETDKRTAEGIPYHKEVIGWFQKIETELALNFSFT